MIAQITPEAIRTIIHPHCHGNVRSVELLVSANHTQKHRTLEVKMIVPLAIAGSMRSLSNFLSDVDNDTWAVWTVKAVEV